MLVILNYYTFNQQGLFDRLRFIILLGLPRLHPCGISLLPPSHLEDVVVILDLLLGILLDTLLLPAFFDL